jgi:Arc/MetJ-type ribon-helix-helix transcriptional regulator
MAIAKIDGFQDGGTAVEPTTGNNVPVGALPNEVADDIDAKLSEGEFVIPADVVRFIGLERLMKLRDNAKRGLQRMAEIGQMGNAEEVGEKAESTFEEGEEEDTGQFESDIDELLAEEDSAEGQTERMMAVGGLASSYASGFDISKAPKNPVFDVRYLKHGDGRMMYITYINGKPMTPIPDGFREITREEAVSAATAADEAKKIKPAEGAGGSGEGGGGEGLPSPSPIDIEAVKSGDVSALKTGTTVSPTAVKAVGAIMGALTGSPLGLAANVYADQIAGFLSNQSGALAGKENIEAVGKAFGLDTKTTEGKAAASSIIDSMSSYLGGATDGKTTEQSTVGTDAFGPDGPYGPTSYSTSAMDASGGSADLNAPSPSPAPSPEPSPSPAPSPSAPESVATSSPVSDYYGGPSFDTVGYGGAGDVGGSDSFGGSSSAESSSASANDSGMWAKGGLVGKRKPKAKRGKGLVAQK